MTASGQPVYSIGAVAKMLSVPAATIRTWEDRYGVVLPGRSPGGQRLYSRDQLEQLRFLAAHVTEGFSAADAHRLLRDLLGKEAARDAVADDRRRLILLAERDTFAAGFAEHFLRAEGFDVAAEFGADAALARAAEISPDLVKVDLLISGGRGLQLCRQLSARTDAPILAVCTLVLPDAALDAGAAAFLQRPAEPARLVAVVRDLLANGAVAGRPPAMR